MLLAANSTAWHLDAYMQSESHLYDCAQHLQLLQLLLQARSSRTLRTCIVDVGRWASAGWHKRREDNAVQPAGVIKCPGKLLFAQHIKLWVLQVPWHAQAEGLAIGQCDEAHRAIVFCHASAGRPVWLPVLAVLCVCAAGKECQCQQQQRCGWGG